MDTLACKSIYEGTEQFMLQLIMKGSKRSAWMMPVRLVLTRKGHGVSLTWRGASAGLAVIGAYTGCKGKLRLGVAHHRVCTCGHICRGYAGNLDLPGH